MVKRLFGLVNREVVDIHDAAYLLALFTFATQILGLFRDRLLAHIFGAGRDLDVYYAAFRVPDLIFVSVASLVSASVLIPFLQDKALTDKIALKKFINNTFTIFVLTVCVVSVIAFIFMPKIIPIIFPGIDSASLQKIIGLSRVLLLSPVFMGVSNMFSSITQIGKRFLLYALCPLFYNISILFAVYFLYPLFGLYGIIFGVIFGAFLHASIQFPYLSRNGLVPDIVFPIDFKGFGKLVSISLPRTLTLSITSIAMLFLFHLASKMSSGSIAIFNLSYNLQSVPMAIIGISYSMAAFPVLSQLYSSGEKKKFIDHISVATRHIIFLSLPVVALFIVLRAQIVRTVLGSGNFSWNDTRLVAACFALFALSVVAQSLILLFVRAYYASGFTKKPLIINTVSALFMVFFSFVFFLLFQKFEGLLDFFEFMFKVEGVRGTLILSLPLGFSVGSIFNIILFLFIFEKDFKNFFKTIKTTIFHSFSSAVIVGFVSYIGLNIFDKVFNINTLYGIFMQGLLSGILGIISGIYILKVLGSRELQDVSKTLRRKIWKAKVVAPNQTEL